MFTVMDYATQATFKSLSLLILFYIVEMGIVANECIASFSPFINNKLTINKLLPNNVCLRANDLANNAAVF